MPDGALKTGRGGHVVTLLLVLQPAALLILQGCGLGLGFAVSFRIRRDLRTEPWRTEATRRLAERIDRRLKRPRQAPCLARENHENI